jgi:hypothetical protein
MYIVIVIVCIANKRISEIHLCFEGYVSLCLPWLFLSSWLNVTCLTILNMDNFEVWVLFTGDKNNLTDMYKNKAILSGQNKLTVFRM